ncbi:MAG: 2-dehydro-3-deoxygalactonokinase [Burkholderiales bacterium]|nr:2-dehydro-3-deoxygalactonokinase [Burkholderiales bacterium]MDE2395949.1 2-dehydro-3-deoxygalactonokinase [Burkholderiales bacterium]MDE2451953.1 2-dehydro-3-deoxygalactonokinase [Burkholderiales bacterium]
MPTEPTPELLALDWGTSSLRAFLMAAGAVLQTRQSTQGIQHLPAPGAEGFEQALEQIGGDWLRRWPGLPVMAGGMVGSAQGWREAAYAECPADLGRLAAGAVRLRCRLGSEVTIAPGVLYAPAAAPPDVMRGEEVQIAGALLGQPGWAARSRIVLPGTHSKWVEVREGRIERFATFMTGEMFALLRRHSILGRSMAPDAAPDTAAFERGLEAARRSRPGEFLHQIFEVRSLGLVGRLTPAAQPEYLSGLLIGHELAAGLGATDEAAPLLLIGDPALCRRYAVALRWFDSGECTLLDNTAPAGLWALAQAARVG